MRCAALTRALALITVGFLIPAGIATAGLPDNGLLDNGVPDNGLPDNGLPDNGLLFFNASTHAFWVSNPFTVSTFKIPGNPLSSAIRDQFNAMVVAYQWQLCHPAGDDATVLDSDGHPHTFHGLIVLAGGHGWHNDQALDFATARFLSAATITQLNPLPGAQPRSAEGWPRWRMA